MFMPASVLANMTPVFELEEADRENASSYLASLPKMEQAFHFAPLGQQSVVTLPGVVIDGVKVDRYEFVITRRYLHGGELHLGGANGEVFNATKFIADFKEFLESNLNEQ